MSESETGLCPGCIAFSRHQRDQVDRLLQNGGGVTYGEIAQTIDYEWAPSSEGDDELQAYLLKQIALGHARRLWNNDLEDHFYLAIERFR